MTDTHTAVREMAEAAHRVLNATKRHKPEHKRLQTAVKQYYATVAEDIRRQTMTDMMDELNQLNEL